jgi:hypothetical protein
VHLHALLIDGVFERVGEGLVFNPAGRLTRGDAAAVVGVAVRQVQRHGGYRARDATLERHLQVCARFESSLNQRNRLILK